MHGISFFSRLTPFPYSIMWIELPQFGDRPDGILRLEMLTCGLSIDPEA